MPRYGQLVSRVTHALRGRPSDPPAAEPDGPLFISDQVEVVRGAAAAHLLAGRNDARYLSPVEGIVRVDRDRWDEAQRYEERTWMVLNQGVADDRNEEHLRRFDGLVTLDGLSFRRAIEVGCGPFTNLRLVLPRVEVREVELLDPLIERYVEHPNCTYAKRTLLGKPVRMHASALEDFAPDGTYDLVVMINVLEHCIDAHGAFAKIIELLEPGGYLVFHDKLYTAEWIEPERLYDAGHPLRVRGAVIEQYLHNGFEPVFDRTIDDPEVGLPMKYFIGVRR